MALCQCLALMSRLNVSPRCLGRRANDTRQMLDSFGTHLWLERFVAHPVTGENAKMQAAKRIRGMNSCISLTAGDRAGYYHSRLPLIEDPLEKRNAARCQFSKP
jgi:hypothetical protein